MTQRACAREKHNGRMNDPASPAPGVRSKLWRAGVLIDDDLTLDELRALPPDDDHLVWIDLTRPSPETLRAIMDEVHLPPTAVEDALAPLERAKLTRHDTHLFFTAYGTTLRPERDRGRGHLSTHRISGIVTANALVTIRLDEGIDMDAIVHRWEDDPALLRLGSRALVYGLLDALVDNHFDTIQRIDDDLERLEDVLFDDRTTNRSFQQELYGLRKDLVTLRRVVTPMREVVNGLLRHDPHAPDALSVWYDDLYDHVLRATEWSESLRDVVASLFETNLSLQDARLNTIMKKLAAWAAIIAVPTAITGWFGQNVPYPGFNAVDGYYWSLALVIACPLLLWLVFRRFGWV